MVQSGHRRLQEGLKQVGIQIAQFLAEPRAAGNALIGSKAVGSRVIQLELEPKLDDEQGMLEQKAAQVGGVAEAFVDADEKGGCR